ncbi:hypothetical protein ACQP2P_29890 [Dactylosporangium sp. CA-139114]|uniref:hypothetical protein n=1 Tax=Dactylosporangium sp. CA-139114 TaxID=3239931 RepID=UPI003D971447
MEQTGMIGWLDGVWASTHLVQIVEGGEAAGPLPGRAVLAELREPPALGALRALTTTGRFTGDICRCHGHTTVVLRGTAGEALACASLHAYGSVSWERSRFRNDLEVVDAAGLHPHWCGSCSPTSPRRTSRPPRRPRCPAPVAMGVVNLLMTTGDDPVLASAVAPTLRRLFPPPPAQAARRAVAGRDRAGRGQHPAPG